MANGEIEKLLKFANQQMAAEAFLAQSLDSVPNRPAADDIKSRLISGNTHASRFTVVQADEFVNNYSVLTQYRNDPLSSSGTGFSGTLFQNKTTGELTLSFRSTEFIDDNVRDSKSTNELEVKELGWAFGQIDEMEKWYAALRSDPTLLKNRRFNVTGYSLGGHLATAFNILRREEDQAGLGSNPIISTYTFNGAGVGDLKPGVTLHQVLANFRAYRDDPNLLSNAVWGAIGLSGKSVLLNGASDRVLAIASEESRIAGLGGVTFALNATSAPHGSQASLQYQIAALLAARDTVASSLFLGTDVNTIPTQPKFAASFGRDAIAGMTEIVGSDSGNLGPSWVSNSGIHYGTRQEVFIENQPLTRGIYSLSVNRGSLTSNPGQNDFADTHSLVLLIDSLSLMATMERLDPDFAVSAASSLFQAISNAKSQTLFGTQGKAEGDVLERMLDSLRKIILGPGVSPTVDYNQTLLGNTWHDINLRTPYQDNIKQLNDRISDLRTEPGYSLRLDVLAGKTAEEIRALASETESQANAYRYALVALNPFALVGFDYGERDASLAIFNADSGLGVTNEYVRDRSRMLAWKNRDFAADGNVLLRSDERETYKYVDKAFSGPSGPDLVISVRGRQASAVISPAFVIFGGDSDDSISGGDVAIGDSLFGGGGNDLLDAQAGNDYLEGNAGDDTLIGGIGDDELNGGPGFDTYVYTAGDGSDLITDPGGAGEIRYNGRILTGGQKVSDGFYRDTQGVEFVLIDGGPESQGLLIDGNIFIEDFASGSLGIVLDGEVPDPTPPESDSDHFYDHYFHADDYFLDSGSETREVSNLFGSNVDDTFLSAGSEDYFGRAGNDVAIFDTGSVFTGSIDMGADADLIDASASTGADENSDLVGGGGNDFITGSSGADRIWGDNAFARSTNASALDTENPLGLFFVDGFSYNNLGLGRLFVDPGFGAFNFVQSNRLFPGVDELVFIPEGAILAGTLSEVLANVIGASFDDYIDAGAGDDIVHGGSGSDQIYGGEGNDRLTGDLDGGINDRMTYSNLRAQFGIAANAFGLPGDDLIDGGDGNDKLSDLDGGNDTLLGGAGDDTIVSIERNRSFGDGIVAHNIIDGGEGNDSIELENQTGGFDVIEGGEGDDQIFANAYHDESAPAGTRAFVVAFGGEGNDVFNITADEAIVDGGAGDDVFGFGNGSYSLSDEAGDDTLNTLLFDLAPLDQFLEEFSPVPTGEPGEKLDFTVARDGSDLVAMARTSIDGADVSLYEVRINDWYAGPAHQIEHVLVGGDIALTAIEFESWGGFHAGTDGDDEILDPSEYSDRVVAGGGNDLVFTGDGADRILGGAGDDELYGGAGDDTYYYALGDGNDIIDDTSGNDEIRFGPGIAREDVAVRLGDSKIVLALGAARIEITNGSRSDPGVERLRFSDGTMANVEALLPAPEAPSVAPEPELDPEPEQVAGSPAVETPPPQSEEAAFVPEPASPSPIAETFPIPAPEIIAPAVSVKDSGTAGVALASLYVDLNFPAPDTSPAFGKPAADPSDESSARAGAPLDMQALMEAVNAFDAGAEANGADVARVVDSPSESGPVDEPADSVRPLNSWALTNALLQFHLDGLGADGTAEEVVDFSTASTLVAGSSLARQAGPLVPFGSGLQGLTTFSGLQEGLARL